MRSLRAVRLAVALAAGVALAGCRRANAGTMGIEKAQTDSLVGIVHVIGVEARPEVTLTLDDAKSSVILDGPASLRHLSELRVAVVGERAGARLVVRRFTVLSANGVPATDGVIAAERESLFLVTSDGTRHRLVGPPPLLRNSVGRRVWISGPLEREPVAYGIIE